MYKAVVQDKTPCSISFQREISCDALSLKFVLIQRHKHKETSLAGRSVSHPVGYITFLPED